MSRLHADRNPRAHASTASVIDAAALAWDLRARVRGDVRFDAGAKALYATDASNYRQVPIGVVVPRDIDDVVEAVAVCREHRAPLLSRGPFDEDALRLSKQSFTLAEFLTKRVGGWRAPRLEAEALVHGHCHHKAVIGFEREAQLYRDMGLRADFSDHGCCGMAGSFGFECAHYRISQACGERSLLPAVRALREDALLIADGFSCREQIRQATHRVPLHTAQVLRRALRRQAGEQGA